MLLTTIAFALTAAMGPTTGCSAAAPALTAHAVLARAIAATGMRSSPPSVLRLQFEVVRELRDLSDRSTPPFSASVATETLWFDPMTGVERTTPFGPRGDILWSAPLATATGRDSAAPVAASEILHGYARWQRAFDAWAVLAEWETHADVVVAGRCPFRGLPRIALLRHMPAGDETLLLSEADGLPVALRRTESSYFMGPEAVDYIYRDWDRLGAATLPMTSIRVVDGSKDRLRQVTVGPAATALVSRDSAPRFATMPALVMRDTVVVPPTWVWDTSPPDTVRVGPHSFLFVGRSFTSAVVLARDTVFILDAAQGEARARQDSSWIGRVFPGRHALAVVVATDIWPHIAGLRYWVANGATVITHPQTRSLVERAIARRWQAAPDLLERRRATVHPRIDTVSSVAMRAGGAVEIFAINESASEGVLGTYFADDGFLWASDRIQDASQPSTYVSELRRTVARLKLAPRWTSGPHFKVLSWSTIERLGPP